MLLKSGTIEGHTLGRLKSKSGFEIFALKGDYIQLVNWFVLSQLTSPNSNSCCLFLQIFICVYILL